MQMPRIKTKDAIKGAVRQFDRSRLAANRFRRAYVKTRNTAENSTYTQEASAEEYASDKVENGAWSAAQKSTQILGRTAQRGIRSAREELKSVRTAKRGQEKTIKTVMRAEIKTAQKSVKTAEYTSKTAVKTTAEATKKAEKAAREAAKTAKKTARNAKETAKLAVKGVKAAVRVTVSAIKAIISASKALISLIATGGGVAVIVIILLCVVAYVFCSCLGIFASGEESGTGITMPQAVREINRDYQNRIDGICTDNPHDTLELSGSRADWAEILSVYAVKTTDETAQEVVTMDEEKLELLRKIFWDMNEISYEAVNYTGVTTIETTDEAGNTVTEQVPVTQTLLYITITHKSAEEMADEYGFDENEREQLVLLLDEKNHAMWNAVIYGVGNSDIVSVAFSQLGNIGGEIYWRWYGYEQQVDWCACFVSWCANECGYIDAGALPRFSSCTLGVRWFKEKGQWRDGGYLPAPGDIIFFDWDKENGQDGEPDHVGIVEKADSGMIYTIEGNSLNTCRECVYAMGGYEIYGYGIGVA